MSIEILNKISNESGFPVKVTSDENAHIGMRHVNVTIEIEGDCATLLIFEPITRCVITFGEIALDADTVDISHLTFDQLAAM
jgi:hypothetical protein